MEHVKFRDWLETLPGAPTPSVVAEVANLPRPTLLRHAERGHTTAENAIAIARAYNVPPADALVEMGFLEADEVNASDKLAVREALKRADWEDIFAEITARVNASPMFEGTFELSLDTPVEIPEPADLEAKRKAKEAGEHPASDWESLPRPERPAADSSDPEPGLGDEGYHDGP